MLGSGRLGVFLLVLYLCVGGDVGDGPITLAWGELTAGLMLWELVKMRDQSDDDRWDVNQVQSNPVSSRWWNQSVRSTYRLRGLVAVQGAKLTLV